MCCFLQQNIFLQSVRVPHTFEYVRSKAASHSVFDCTWFLFVLQINDTERFWPRYEPMGFDCFSCLNLSTILIQNIIGFTDTTSAPGAYCIRDTDHISFDIGQSGQASLGDCQSWCNSMGNCVAFMYSPPGNPSLATTCWAKYAFYLVASQFLVAAPTSTTRTGPSLSSRLHVFFIWLRTHLVFSGGTATYTAFSPTALTSSYTTFLLTITGTNLDFLTGYLRAIRLEKATTCTSGSSTSNPVVDVSQSTVLINTDLTELNFPIYTGTLAAGVWSVCVDPATSVSVSFARVGTRSLLIGMLCASFLPTSWLTYSRFR